MLLVLRETRCSSLVLAVGGFAADSPGGDMIYVTEMGLGSVDGSCEDIGQRFPAGSPRFEYGSQFILFLSRCTPLCCTLVLDIHIVVHARGAPKYIASAISHILPQRTAIGELV